ncbi:MAG: hypothetical protein MUP15_02030 [Dehalococcoidia bacterium]|nr:hypothetical protein [Dehalococcoidia bacterium]
MKQALVKSVLIPLVCCLAFGAAYVSVHRTFGQEAPTAPAATPEVSASVTPDSTSTPPLEPTAMPDDTSPTAPVQTRAPGSPPSFDELGEPAPAGSVFEKDGVRLQIPEGLGDFRVLYPVIVDWGFAPDVDHPNVVMTVYNPQTHSSLFFRFEDSPEGPRPIELGRHVEQAEANAALDSIAASAEVAR